MVWRLYYYKMSIEKIMRKIIIHGSVKLIEFGRAPEAAKLRLILHLVYAHRGRAIRFNLFALRDKKDFRYYPSRCQQLIIFIHSRLYCGTDCSGKPVPCALVWTDLQRKAGAPPNINYQKMTSQI